MKRWLGACMIVLLLLTSTCYAEEYDLPNMTSQQLKQLIKDINAQLSANHETTSAEESRVESAVKTYVEEYYGSSNVSWAWFDYTYTKEWDYFSMSTHADVKKGNERTRCDIYADLYRSDDQFIIVRLTVGNDELIDDRDSVIDDPRVRIMLGLSDAVDTSLPSDKGTATAATNENVEKKDSGNPAADRAEESAAEPETPESTVIAKRGDRNDTVKDIQSILIRLNYLSGNADGDFGQKTEAAVMSFQNDCGMEQTGVVTEEVYAALVDASSAIPEAVNYERYTAKEIYDSFNSNEIAANSKYKGKTIEVTGKIDEIGTSVFGTPYVYLKADSYGFNLLHFEFSRNALDQLAALEANQTVTIRAKCTGWTVMYVYFDDSELVK